MTETCKTRREVTELTGTREIEGRLHGKDGVEEDAHTHTQVVEDNGGELAERVGTRCGQRGSLLQEQGEGVCPLEADLDQVGPVEPGGVEGASAANGCTRSLGGMEAPGPLVVARVPSMNVPVCVVKGVSATPCVSGVVTSVPECVLPSTQCVEETLCVRAPRVWMRPRVWKRPRV